MPSYTLYITFKNYSSWSLRAWLLMRAFDIPFTEEMVPLDKHVKIPALAGISPTGKVPCLLDGEVTVWESLGIAEYLAEKHPAKRLWPSSQPKLSHARSISAEMQNGFPALRTACPMNMRRPLSVLVVADDVKADVARIMDMWTDCLARYGGPFLFGDFTIADAMYAPVYSRIKTYRLAGGVDQSDMVARYGQAMESLPAWQEWHEAALAETANVPVNEV
jgi:glutathione S-transferase